MVAAPSTTLELSTTLVRPALHRHGLAAANHLWRDNLAGEPGDSALLKCSWPSVITIPVAAMDMPSLKR